MPVETHLVISMKRSPRSPFVTTFARAATLVAATLGAACSSSSDASRTDPRLDSEDADASPPDAGDDLDGATTQRDAAGDDAGSAADTDLAESDSADAAAACPKSAPVLGDKCTTGPIVCDYPDPCPLRPKGKDTYAVECHIGKWALAGDAYEAPCPVDVPEEDGACLCGAHMPKACGYDICDVEGDPPLLALCDEKSATWLIMVSECNPPPPPTDAGPRDAAAGDAADTD